METSAPASGTNSTSSSLLRGAQRQDPHAWRRLADLYGPMIYGWCRRYGLSPSDAADALQDTLSSVHRGIGQFNPAAGSFRGWIWTIARNKIRDQARRQARQPRAAGGTDQHQALQQIPDILPEDETREQAAWRQLLQRGLDQVRDDFEPRTWQAFWRVTVDGVPAAEVATELGLSAASVRQARCRVLRRLRDELGPEVNA